MENKEFYQLIGRITCSLGRIDFLLSNIAVDLKLAATYPEFYALTSIDKKIKALKGKAEHSFAESVTKQKFIDLMNEIDSLRIRRNSVVHSIILQNDNEFLLYNFKKKGSEIIHDVKEFTSDEIRELDSNFIKAHNKLYTLWQDELNP